MSSVFSDFITGTSRSGCAADGFHTKSTLIPNDFVLPWVSRQVPRQTFPSTVSVYHSRSSIVSRRHPCATARSFTQIARSPAFHMLAQPYKKTAKAVVKVVSFIAVKHMYRLAIMARSFLSSLAKREHGERPLRIAARHFASIGSNSIIEPSAIVARNSLPSLMI